MIAALTYVGVSAVVLLVLTFIYVVEDIKGERVFLLHTRTKLDTFFVLLIKRIEIIMYALTNGVVRLLLHYGAHSVLKRVLAMIRSLEQRVEDLVRHNRNIAKNIGALRTNTHFSAIAEHKEEVALREKEKDQLRSH